MTASTWKVRGFPDGEGDAYGELYIVSVVVGAVGECKLIASKGIGRNVQAVL
ncbi:hypothetical protein [Paenibacillus naphthalenovorans]|uniref:hypothetical protein n=1 Tax=Paenibacillus naphthalenovorans TaxID=162209 RepID=UPI000AB05B52|nr:hypothetical protein [Paenibacillus naphthalenovorans]